jgi:ornithine cyclodeaminase/alanine dehydrogenase-like protein (mu-crystallin family)
VTELGAVLAGDAPGRQNEGDITAFDSTGLAIQDLAITLAVDERYRDDPDGAAFDSVSTIEVGG